MELSVEEIENGIMVLRVDGGLDSSNAQAFGNDVQRRVDAGRVKLILDGAKLDYISSLGVAVLLRLHGKVKTLGGDIKLAGLRGAVGDVISIFQLDKVFAIYPDVAAARAGFEDADPNV